MIQSERKLTINNANKFINSPPEEDELESLKFNLPKDVKLFSLMMTMASLTKKNSYLYKFFVRCVIWACFILCTFNLVYETTSYRNILFDTTLSFLHLWVCISLEIWNNFINSRIWKTILSGFYAKSQHNKVTYFMGLLGLILIILSSSLIILGWLLPISMTAMSQSDEITTWSFNIIHGCLMLIIILPWASVFLCSIFMFYILAEALKIDLDTCFELLKNIYKKGEVTFIDIMNVQKHYGESRGRLHKSYRQFSTLHLSFIIICTSMIISGFVNIQQKYIHRDYLNYNKWCQDIFYLAMGSIGVTISLLSPLYITKKGLLFLEETNRLFTLYEWNIDKLAKHNALVTMFVITPFEYAIYGITINPQNIAYFLRFSIELLIFALVYSMYG